VITHKIVFSGPVGAGKTTAIGAVSDIPPVVTDVRASDDVALQKGSTTVAMDYGVLDLDSGERVHLFGTPGQERFDFMWEILGEGMLGYVVLVDAEREDSLHEAAGILGAFRRMARVPYVVALNRSSGIDDGEEARIRERLELRSDIALLPCDATDKESVKSVLLALLYAVLDEVEAERASV